MERLGDMPDMRLTGLVRNADLNGRLVALLDFTDGRWDVVTSDGRRLRVLPANLEPDEEGAQVALQSYFLSFCMELSCKNCSEAIS